MSTAIFYFSGTGNSLAVAQKIAKHLDAGLISIPEAIRAKKTACTADRIGIVFPAYLAPVAGLPGIVLRFIQALELSDQNRIFAVCTCGGYRSVNALPALQAFEKVVKSAGGHCRASYSVRLPMNNLDYDHIPIPIQKHSGKIINKSKRKIEKICRQLECNSKTRFPILKTIFLWLMKPVFKAIGPLAMNALREKAQTDDLSLSVYELIPLTDKSITVNDQCTGCGICANVCPAENIKITAKRPVFQHACEMCFACDEWCPAGAVQHWCRKENIKYHHPEITLKNMLK